MRYPYRNLAPLLLALALSPVAVASEPSAIRESLNSNLAFMKGVYQAEYAPKAWKKANFGWDLDQEISRALAAAQASPNITLTDARKILMSFIYSMKDYHVGITFQSTERASLPIIIQGVGENPRKYFLVWIDRAKLPLESFPFNEGDQVVGFGGLSTAAAVTAVQAERPANIDKTDRALAELYLTGRAASFGYQVPRGPVELSIIPKGSDKPSRKELIWDYTPEKILDFSTLVAARSDMISSPSRSALNAAPLNLKMRVNLGVGRETPFDIGSRKTFAPVLGLKLWETDETEPFHAYLFQLAGGKLGGYVRIPSFAPADTSLATASFAKLIERFQKTADVLVIDQINNPGGSVFYLYGLASMLTDQPLATPKHRISIVQADVLAAEQSLDQLSVVKDDDSAKKLLGPAVEGYPVSFEVAGFIRGYFNFIMDEWKLGSRLSRPSWLLGVDEINPAPAHYTKPILLLTNALDFSGGDFFPAILQDNKRVTILGTRTAGAGGYVNEVTYPNDLGIASFSVTESIAQRVDETPIENLGVKPTIECELTEKDLTDGYSDYAKAIQSALNALIKP